jgi:hypothetical protein
VSAVDVGHVFGTVQVPWDDGIVGDVVSWYAAIVSTGSLIVAFLAWRASGPRLRVRAALLGVGEDRRVVIFVDNRGGADLTIEWADILLAELPVLPHLGRTSQVKSPVVEPELPYRLASRSSTRLSLTTADAWRPVWDDVCVESMTLFAQISAAGRIETVRVWRGDQDPWPIHTFRVLKMRRVFSAARAARGSRRPIERAEP